MLALANKVFATVNLTVNSRNGEVIGKAFKDASIHCPNCSYPENASDFDYWINIHANNKIDLHRAKRTRNGHMDYCTPEVWSYPEIGWGQGDAELRVSPCKTCNNLSTKAYQAEREAKSTRHMLKQNWPCAECIMRYNPTARICHVIKNNPELKGFLDV